jgi:hypothetical protein
MADGETTRLGLPVVPPTVSYEEIMNNPALAGYSDAQKQAYWAEQQAKVNLAVTPATAAPSPPPPQLPVGDTGSIWAAGGDPGAAGQAPGATRLGLPARTPGPGAPTMIDPTKVPGYKAPTAPVDPLKEAYRIATTDPGKLTPEQAWMIHQNTKAQNAALMAANPDLGVARTSQWQSGTTDTNQTTKGLSETTATRTSDTTSGQTTHGMQETQLSPEAKASVQKEVELAGQRGQVEQALGLAQAKGASDSAAILGGWAEQQKGLAAEQIRAQAEQTKRLEQLDQSVQKANREYSIAAQNLDPNRLFSGPKKWLSAIALGLGAYGASLARTPNFAQQIIDQAIARDIDAQKVAIQGKRDELSFAQQIYRDQRARFTDDNAARQATYGAMYNVISTQLLERAQRMKGTEYAKQAEAHALELQQNAQQRMSSALQQEARTVSSGGTEGTSITTGTEAATTQSLQQTTGRTSTTQSGGTASRTPGLGAGGLIEDPIKALGDFSGDLAAAQKTFPDRGAPTKSDEESARKATDQVGGYLELISQAQRLRELNDLTSGVSGWIDKKIRWSEAAKDRAVSKFGFFNAVKLATTGVNARQDEMERQDAAYESGNWSAKSLNQALDEQMRSARLSIGARLQVLQPRLREELIDRLRAGGMSPSEIAEIQSGRSNTAPNQATRLGLTTPTD